MATEFDLIKTYFSPLSYGLVNNECGIGDDGAVLNTPQNQQLVVVTDTLVCGVHFPEETAAYDIAWKALAVNLSDLAAMGAKPGFFSLALTLPNQEALWLKDFSQGLADLAAQHAIPLIGGDTTKGPLTITVTANGWVENNKAILRNTAQVEQDIWVTNTLGDAALGLKIALQQLPDNLKVQLNNEDIEFLLASLNRPQPQLMALPLLNRFAQSAIDISDGFLADLTHILQQSSTASGDSLEANIELNSLPLSNPMKKFIAVTDDWSGVLAGGDDYQICFTAKSKDQTAILQMAKELGIRVSRVGKITIDDTANMAESEKMQRVPTAKMTLTKDGQPYKADSQGYLHF